MDPLDPHGRLALAVTIYLAALGVWGLVLGIAGSGPTPAYRGSLVIAEAAIVLQGVLGLLAWPAHGPAEGIHVLYGLALVAAIPLAASIVRQGSPRRTALSLGLAAFFAAGLAIRGMTTA